jgi:hypothetical protein
MTDNDNAARGNPVDSERTEEEQRAFYDAVMARTQAALAIAGRVTHCFDVAGYRMRVVFAGPRLAAEFVGALAHLACDDDGPADVTLYAWDSESTGIDMVPPPCAQSAFTDRGDIWGFSSRAVRSAFHWSEFSVSLYDTAAGVGLYWVNTTKDLPYWAKSSPMRSLFHWAIEQRGLQLVHASAFGDENGGVLITGKGGVGKSTTALAALTAGMTYIGDDYLIVGLDPEPTAYTLYSTAKLEPHQAARFPNLAALAEGQTPAPGEKVVLNLYPSHADQIVRSVPLKWVLTPRFNDGEETVFEPISAVDLHRAAAFTTMSQLAHAGLTTHDFIRRMVEKSPRRRIKLGRDISGVPRAIKALLADPNAATAPDQVTTAHQPLITVVVPVYNGAEFLREAIASVLAQNYSALEIIVVDDGSDDEIEAAVAALPVDVRFFRQANGGPAAARNRGIRDASGEYIAFLDVDDLWPEGNLASLVSQIEETGADVVIGRGQLAQMAAQGRDYSFVGNPGESFPDYIGAALYRRDVFPRNGLFDADMRYGEDTDWYNRARENKLDVLRAEQTSLIVRRHAGNMTRGKTMVELAVLRVAKKALDRRRLAAMPGQ